MKNPTIKKLTKSTKKGFIALFTVTLVSLLAASFTLLVSIRIATQSISVFEIQALKTLEHTALSCISIARLKIHRGESSIDGEYFAHTGNCEIKNTRVSAREISLDISAKKADTKISFSALLDRPNLELVSLEEI